MHAASFRDSNARSHQYFTYVLYGLVLTISYFVAAKLGLSFAVISNNVTLIWPPTGIALFSLFLLGIRYWPWILLGAFITNATTGIGYGASTAIAIGNCAEAVTGFYLLQLAQFNSQLKRVRDIVYLVILAAGLSTIISATIGTSTLLFWQVITIDIAFKTWSAWWMGDAMGNLVFASLLFAWNSRQNEIWNTLRALEAATLILSLIVASQLIFSEFFLFSTRNLPLAFMTFPFLIWSSIRFGIRGATTSVFIIGAVIMYNIIHDSGLFSQGSAYESLTLFWLYTNIIVITSMILAASVSERQLVESGMRYQAQHDSLTGLPNRLTLNDRIEKSMAHADREHSLLVIMFLDIDHFKLINDSMGHSIGDSFLIKVADRLQLHFRKNDTVTRHGGDEFIIILDDIETSTDIIRIVKNLLATLNEPFCIQNVPLHASASIGVTVYPSDGTDPDTLLKNADTAMYRAKHLGRNTFAFFSSDMNTLASNQLTLQNQLRSAVSNKEFLLHYQPQYDSITGKIIGAEALLRWQSPSEGLISPDRFIPCLEEMGLIGQVGEWVLDSACEQLSIWHKSGWDHLHMAVNISSRQLSDSELPAQVHRALNSRNLPASKLELEITESMLVRQELCVEQNMQRLVKLGIRMAVDDFGTGYSSLSYLHQLSIDTLKIDRAFVENIPGNENSEAIARAIVGLGKSLHLHLVAEGIETEQQQVFLKELGCQSMQGYLFSKPVTAEEFTQLIEAEHTINH